jgi:hypothetical protein
MKNWKENEESGAHRHSRAMAPAATAAIDQQHGDGEHHHQKNDVGQIELH